MHVNWNWKYVTLHNMNAKKIIVVKDCHDDFLFKKLNHQQLKLKQDKDLSILFKQLYD